MCFYTTYKKRTIDHRRLSEKSLADGNTFKNIFIDLSIKWVRLDLRPVTRLGRALEYQTGIQMALQIWISTPE